MAAATTTSSVLATVLLCAAAAFLFLAAHAADDHHYKQQEKHYRRGDGDLVTKTCEGGRGYEWSPRLSSKFCESTLRSDKRSAAAKHPRELALFAMDLLQSAAAAAGAKVDGVLRSRHGKSTALALHYCRLDYDAMARTIPVCRALVQKYYPKAAMYALSTYDYYADCAGRLRGYAAHCWGYVLEDDELAKVVSKEVVEVFQRASLVRAMVVDMQLV